MENERRTENTGQRQKRRLQATTPFRLVTFVYGSSVPRVQSILKSIATAVVPSVLLTERVMNFGCALFRCIQLDVNKGSFRHHAPYILHCSIGTRYEGCRPFNPWAFNPSKQSMLHDHMQGETREPLFSRHHPSTTPVPSWHDPSVVLLSLSQGWEAHVIDIPLHSYHHSLTSTSQIG